MAELQSKKFVPRSLETVGGFLFQEKEESYDERL